MEILLNDQLKFSTSNNWYLIDGRYITGDTGLTGPTGYMPKKETPPESKFIDENRAYQCKITIPGANDKLYDEILYQIRKLQDSGDNIEISSVRPRISYIPDYANVYLSEEYFAAVAKVVKKNQSIKNRHKRALDELRAIGSEVYDESGPSYEKLPEGAIYHGHVNKVEDGIIYVNYTSKTKFHLYLTEYKLIK